MQLHQLSDIRINLVPTILESVSDTEIVSVSPLELESIVRDCVYASHTKEQRPAIVQSMMEARPKQQDSSYSYWSGFQPIDIDIKDRNAADLAHKVLHNYLFKFNWCRAVTRSTGGSGLHIYTYTKPLYDPGDPDLSTSLAMQREQKEYYLNAYEYKYTVVWKALCMLYDSMIEQGIDPEIAKQLHPTKNTKAINKNTNKTEVLDTSACRISQPMQVTQDADIHINKSFKLTRFSKHIDAGFYENTHEKYDILQLKTAFDKLRNRFESTDNSLTELQVRRDLTVMKFAEEAEITPRNYNNSERYRIAYTLANIYELRHTGHSMYRSVERMFLLMCSGNPKYNAEKSQWATAFRSAVERNSQGTAPSVYWALKELESSHGFKFDWQNNKTTAHLKEVIEQHNQPDQIAGHIMSQIPLPAAFNRQPTLDLTLVEGQYLSDHMDALLNHIKPGINLLISQPGSGKTEWIKRLCQPTRRILLVQPYTSVISSKIETSDLPMQCYYGDRQVDLSKSVHACMTFDKFANIDIEEVNMLFDYVAVDESHLLTSSSYRGNVPADVIDRLLSMHIPVICMTGTPIAEHLFTAPTTIIKVKSETERTKEITFVSCKDDNHKIASIAKHIAKSIELGERILFPTNKGDTFVARITGAVQSILGREVKSEYYKKDNSLYQFVDDINHAGTIGNVELMFCTNYLSVGVDINDTMPFNIIYDEMFAAEEIEQFNCRLRKLDLRSYYYFAREDSNGDPKNLTHYSALDLAYTNENKLEFADILKLHTHTENLQSLYDFFKWAFRAPYFITDRRTGAVHVHETSYKLHMFEARWRQWSQQLVVVKNVLELLGYSAHYVMAEEHEAKLLMQVIDAARQSASDLKQRKNNKIADFIDCIQDQKTLDIINNVNNRDVVDSTKFELKRRTTNNGESKVALLVSDRQIFNKWRHKIRHLSRYYKAATVLDILHDECYTEKTNAFNFSELDRITRASALFDHADQQSMVKSNTFILRYLFEDILTNQETGVYLPDVALEVVFEEIAKTYISNSIGESRSVAFYESMLQQSQKLFKLVSRRISKDGDNNYYAIRKLKHFDSDYIFNRNSMTEILSMMFDASVYGATAEYVDAQQHVKTTVRTKVWDGQQVKASSDTKDIWSIENLPLLEDDDYLFKQAESMRSSEITQRIDMPSRVSDKSLADIDDFLSTINNQSN